MQCLAYWLLAFAVVRHDFAVGVLVGDEHGTALSQSWGDHGENDDGPNDIRFMFNDGTPHTNPFHCKVGLDNFAAEWSDGKKAWCCKTKHLGCPDQHAMSHRYEHSHEALHDGSQQEPFDCEEGLANWQGGWSDSKKEWCCKFKDLFCKNHNYYRGKKDYNHDHSDADHYHNDGHAPTHMYDHFHVGSDLDGPAAPKFSGPHDCAAGLNNWQDGWAKGKKEYCCRRFQLGCEAAGSSLSEFTLGDELTNEDVDEELSSSYEFPREDLDNDDEGEEADERRLLDQRRHRGRRNEQRH